MASTPPAAWNSDGLRSRTSTLAEQGGIRPSSSPALRCDAAISRPFACDIEMFPLNSPGGVARPACPRERGRANLTSSRMFDVR